MAESRGFYKMFFQIDRTWDDRSINHEPVKLAFGSLTDSIYMEIKAPYFNDPVPPGQPGQSYHRLWDYEVVEAFFVTMGNGREKYLEVEFSPHGRHFLLLLNGRKNAIKVGLQCDYSAHIADGMWTGLAKIPKSYFPPNIKLFNAYAIHGVGENRVYEAFKPGSPNAHEFPDFHRLEYFQQIDMGRLFPSGHKWSQLWKDTLNESRMMEGKVRNETGRWIVKDDRF